jgi:hypothetical protein
MGGYWVFDPAVEARHAMVDRFLAKDLALQLLLVHAFLAVIWYWVSRRSLIRLIRCGFNTICLELYALRSSL